MPIKVTCSSCGRTGRVPDHAIGLNVRCPGCGVRRKLTAADLVPEGPAGVEDLEVLDEEPAETSPSGGDPRVRVGRVDELPDYRRRERTVPRPKLKSENQKSTNLNPLTIGLSFGVGILSISLAYILITNRAGSPKAEERSVEGALIAQSAPTPPLPRSEAQLIAKRSDSVPPSSPASSKNQPAGNNSTLLEAKNQAAVSSAPDQLEPAREVRKALAAKNPPPTADSAPPANMNKGEVASQSGDRKGTILSTAEIVSRYEPSVALIKGKGGSGTGFLVAPGILATNAHVIEGEFLANLEVRFPSADEAVRGPLPADLLYEDPKRDLAFLALKTDLPALQVAETYRYRKGEDVTVIGNPGVDGDTVLENAISRGVMSTKAQIDGQQFYQLGIAVNPGNSGGPVFDSTGQVIGVVTLRIPGKEELSFCIPVEELRAGMGKLEAQDPKLAEEVRSKHRLRTVFHGLGSAGAVFGIALELRVASRFNPGNEEVKDKVGRLDEALTKLEQTLLFKLNDEARVARNDPLISKFARTKIGALADNLKKLKGAYQQSRGSTEVGLVRDLKATHRRLVVQIGEDLKEEVSKGILDALEDHLAMTPQGGSMVIIDAPDSSMGALQSRLLERYGLTPPSSRLGRPGFSSPPGRLGPPSFGPGIGPRIPGRIRPPSMFGR